MCRTNRWNSINLQSQLEILTNFSCLHTQRAELCKSCRANRWQSSPGREMGCKPIAALHLLVQQLRLFFGVLTKNRFTPNTRWRHKKIAKECPEPQHWGYTNRLVLFSTYLSFRWTIPLSTGTNRYLPTKHNTHTQGYIVWRFLKRWKCFQIPSISSEYSLLWNRLVLLSMHFYDPAVKASPISYSPR